MKKPMVLIIHINSNGKKIYRVCEDMETAKRLFPNDQKQIIQCFT